MEKQMTMTVNTGTAKKASEVFKRVCNTLETPLRMMRRYYSYVLGREVGNIEAKVITEAQLAFFATVMPADMPLMIRISACAWFVLAVRKCRIYMNDRG